MSRIFLNIGCGDRRLPGFINIDLEPGGDLQWDVTQGLPYPDGSVQGISCAHLLEHLPRPQAIALLRECRRVLVSDGVLRVATVDLASVIRGYSAAGESPEAPELGRDWVQTSCEQVNLLLREGGRQWIYDEAELVRLAEFAGLSLQSRCEPGESDVPELRAVEATGDALVLEFARPCRTVEALPLVSVLIPAYNPRFFEASLQSVLAQTYTRLEILIGDDCPDDGIAKIVARYQDDPRVRYRRNEPRLGGRHNLRMLFADASGEYIKGLNDDDALHPECIARMVQCLRDHPNVTLVTSHRQVIDAAGNHLPDIEATRPPVSADSILNGTDAADLLLRKQMNYIGEPSTPLFRKADLAGIVPHLYFLGGFEIRFNIDVALWLNLLSRGDLIYLTDTLSYFRQHEEQQQAQGWVQEGCAAIWPDIVRHATRMGFIGRDHRAAPRVAPLPAAGDGIALEESVSVVVLTEDEPALARQCLDFLHRYTHVPFQLILVGSELGSDLLDYADELARAHGGGVSHVSVDRGQSYAYRANLGLARAQGARVAVLESDVLVTPGWLSLLLPVLSHSPKVGVVAPRMNDVAGAQGVGAVPYRDLAGMLHFAARWFTEHAGQLSVGPCLAGACLVMRRDVLERVGGFDTSLGSDSAEVEDFCERVGRAGFRLSVAGDLFVHRYGTRPSPAALPGIGAADSLEASLLRAKQVLRAERSAGKGPDAFDPAVDRIPLEYHRIYRPEAPPLSLVDIRAVRLLCIPEWQSPSWKGVLLTYLRAFGPMDPVSLVIRVDPPLPDLIETVVHEVERCLGEAGCSPEEGPDIVIEASYLAPTERGGLYTAATALLSVPSSRELLYAREASACGLPVLEATSPGELRAAAAFLLPALLDAAGTGVPLAGGRIS